MCCRISNPHIQKPADFKSAGTVLQQYPQFCLRFEKYFQKSGEGSLKTCTFAPMSGTDDVMEFDEKFVLRYKFD